MTFKKFESDKSKRLRTNHIYDLHMIRAKHWEKETNRILLEHFGDEVIMIDAERIKYGVQYGGDIVTVHIDGWPIGEFKDIQPFNV